MPSWSSAVPGSETPSLETPGNAELQLGKPHSTKSKTPPTAGTKPKSTHPPPRADN